MKKPTKKQLLVTGGVILLLSGAAGIGYVSQQLWQQSQKGSNNKSKQTNVSGLPDAVDEVQTLRLEGKTDEANKKAETLLGQSSTSKDEKYLLYVEQGNAAMGSKNYSAALTAYQQAATQKADANIYDLIGQAYLSMGNKDQAKASYQKAISLVDPNSPVARSYSTDLQQRIDAIDGKFEQ